MKSQTYGKIVIYAETLDKELQIINHLKAKYQTGQFILGDKAYLERENPSYSISSEKNNLIIIRSISYRYLEDFVKSISREFNVKVEYMEVMLGYWFKDENYKMHHVNSCIEAVYSKGVEELNRTINFNKLTILSRDWKKIKDVVTNSSDIKYIKSLLKF